jgi:recombination protein RecT
MSAAQLGLEPNTPLGQAYLIPYKNKGVDEVQFQIGYKGLIDLAYRSGEVEIVQAQIVYKNDEFECQYGLEPKLVHKPADEDRGDPIKVYAVFKTKSGGYGFEVMSMADVRNHAEKYSKAYSYAESPWKTNFEEMAKKTVLKKVLKYAPMKSDFVRGIVQDETIKSEISEDMYAVPNETVFEADFVEIDTATGEVIEK